MRLLIIGCDYTGKSTLANRIVDWMRAEMGAKDVSKHDHFTFPNSELPPQEREKLMLLGPMAREQYQRFMLMYHLEPAFWYEKDIIWVGFHIDDAAYAALYYGYGAPETYGSRSDFARSVEELVMGFDPHFVTVLLKARPEVIKKRMREHPNPLSPAREEDVENLLKVFDQEYAKCLIGPTTRFVIDTSDLTPDQTFQRWLDGIEPHLTEIDLLRLVNHKAKRS
jgi:thymidylate kinase